MTERELTQGQKTQRLQLAAARVKLVTLDFILITFDWTEDVTLVAAA